MSNVAGAIIIGYRHIDCARVLRELGAPDRRRRLNICLIVIQRISPRSLLESSGLGGETCYRFDIHCQKLLQTTSIRLVCKG